MREVFEVMVTGNAMSLIDCEVKRAKTKRAIERAMAAAFEGEYPESRTVIVFDCPLAVHVDPFRKLVVVITNEHGFPTVSGELVEELLPFCTSVSFA